MSAVAFPVPQWEPDATAVEYARAWCLVVSRGPRARSIDHKTHEGTGVPDGDDFLDIACGRFDPQEAMANVVYDALWRLGMVCGELGCKCGFDMLIHVYGEGRSLATFALAPPGGYPDHLGRLGFAEAVVRRRIFRIVMTAIAKEIEAQEQVATDAENGV